MIENLFWCLGGVLATTLGHYYFLLCPINDALKDLNEEHDRVLRLVNAEITRLRPTDDERTVIEWAIEVADSLATCGATGTDGKPSHEATALREFLERTK
jgi:hypothetical protein